MCGHAQIRDSEGSTRERCRHTSASETDNDGIGRLVIAHETLQVLAGHLRLESSCTDKSSFAQLLQGSL